MGCGQNTSTGSFGDRVAGRDEVLPDEDVGNAEVPLARAVGEELIVGGRSENPAMAAIF
jgi:hypothetical protein